jgi:hypothetical protein
MVYESYTTLLAIDATQILMDDSHSTIEIPRKLKKVIEKLGRDAKIKLLILHDAEVLPSTFFKSKFINEFSDLISFTDDSIDFMFKIGLSLGHKINTILYWSKYEKYELKFSKSLKFVISNSQADIDVDSIPTLGKLEVKPLADLQDFDYDIITDLDDNHFQECFPERYKLETSQSFKNSLDGILAKIKKQFSQVSNIEISKFSNTWSNLIAQHLTSGKTNIKEINLYRDYMLCNVVEQLLSDGIIESECLSLLLQKNFMYKTNDLINWMNVRIDHSLFTKYSDFKDKLLTSTYDDTSYMEQSTRDETISSINKTHASDALTFDSTRWGSEWNSLEESKFSITSKIRNIQPLIELGYDEKEIEEVDMFVLKSFFVKYEQANFPSIKKTSKFVNAISNFIDQTLISKNFRKKFNQITDEDAKQWVCIVILIIPLILVFLIPHINFYHIDRKTTNGNHPK